MTSVYLKFALSIHVLVTVVSLLIHTQPYHDDDLRALLTSTGCAMPCFMGIRPGVTTLQEALEILQSHDWVQDIQVFDLSGANPTGRLVTWKWNDAEPAAVRATWSNQPLWMQSQGGVIAEIDIATNFTLANIWLTLGTPKQGGFDLLSNSAYLNNSVYPELGVRVGRANSCPFEMEIFWNAPQTVVFFRGDNHMGLYDPAYLSQFLRKFRDEYKGC